MNTVTGRDARLWPAKRCFVRDHVPKRTKGALLESLRCLIQFGILYSQAYSRV